MMMGRMMRVMMIWSCEGWDRGFGGVGELMGMNMVFWYRIRLRR